MLSLAVLLALGQALPRIEFESGKLVGVQSASARPHSGTGYVTGFDGDGDTVQVSFAARAGMYRATIGYSAPSGEKGYVLNVNGSRYSGMFSKTGDEFRVHDAGTVELKDGENTIAIEKGWGYFDLDWLEFTPSPAPPSLKSVPARAADAQATLEARRVLKRLTELYGHKMLSGQYDPKEVGQINEATGKRPAILGFDFMEYSPSRLQRGADTDLMTERMIRYAKMGYLLTASWHWNAPSGLLDKEYKDDQGRTINAKWYKGFYTNATSFDLGAALASPASGDYRLLLRDIDALAVELKKLQAVKVPLLWRPLHEAEGGWFWWGAKGPEPFKKLWKLMFDRLTKTHNLHNLIWVFSSGTKPEWYPGDAYVDIVGIDAYPQDWQDPLSGAWETLLRRFDGKKLLAVTEFGGVPDAERMWRFGSRWSYWVSWVGSLGPSKNKPDDLKRIYSSPLVVNLTSRTFAPGR
ncbi:MAG: glycosyl hydrolase [Fimbriimonas sp.]